MTLVLQRNHSLSTASGTFTAAEESLKEISGRIIDMDPEFLRAKERLDQLEQETDEWGDEDDAEVDPKVMCLVTAMIRESAITARTLCGKWTRPSLSQVPNGVISIFWETSGSQLHVLVGPGEDDIRTVIKIADSEPSRIIVPRNEALNFMDSITRRLLLADQ
jgi:hypothetical protein